MQLERTADRRQFLKAAVVLGGGGLVAASASVLKPAFGVVRDGRPSVTHGVQSGDARDRSAVVWARTDRPARMLVDVSTKPSFADARRVAGPYTDASRDFTAHLALQGLPPGRDVFYRVRFADPDDPTLTGEAVAGRLRTAPVARRTVSFVWSGDTAGQGWGIDPDRGGMQTYQSMRAVEPDFFVHSGDTIYGDNPLVESVPLPDGTTWRNLVTPEKAKVAETLDEFRGNFRYNLLDEHLRRFHAEVPVIAQWDDHEVVNNWYPGEQLADPRYTVTNVDILAARAGQAFHEYLPVAPGPGDPGPVRRRVAYGPLLDVFVLDLRRYRGPNSTNDQTKAGAHTAILGSRQLTWLRDGLRASTATWKAIACDLPIGLVVPDESNFEGIAQDRPKPLGRELEIARLLSGIKADRVKNVVWFTADVHYAAAHHYDPARATFTDFDPFWEFVAGPLHAGTFGPNKLDPTFGPEVRFQRAAERPNQPPSDGLQFFGHVSIDGSTGGLTVRLLDRGGRQLYSTQLEPAA